MLETLYIHAFTHHNLDVNQIGLLHIDAADQKRRLGAAKSHFACKEMMFLSTCNRVEFTIVSDQNITTEELLFVLYPEVAPGVARGWVTPGKLLEKPNQNRLKNH